MPPPLLPTFSCLTLDVFRIELGDIYILHKFFCFVCGWGHMWGVQSTSSTDTALTLGRVCTDEPIIPMTTGLFCAAVLFPEGPPPATLARFKRNRSSISSWIWFIKLFPDTPFRVLGQAPAPIQTSHCQGRSLNCYLVLFSQQVHNQSVWDGQISLVWNARAFKSWP